MAVTINGSTGWSYSDNIKHKYGTGDDLQIYHDGSHSYVDGTTTGDLYLRSTNDDIIISAADDIVLQVQGSETGLRCNGDGSVELYYDNTKHFETTSAGCKVSTGVLDFDDSVEARFGTGNDFKIYHDGTYNNIKGVSNHNMYFWTNNTLRTVIQDDGHLRPGTTNTYDLGTSNDHWRNIWMENDLYIADNGMAVFGTGEDFKIYHNATNDFIQSNGGYLKIQTDSFKLHDRSDDHEMITAVNDGAVKVYYDNSLKGYTTSQGWRVYGDCFPHGDGIYDCGQSGERWDDVYATNGTIQTSDKNEKNTIVDSDLGLSFVNKLKPVSYKFNTGTRTHYGLVAQDVETTLSDISKPTTGFAGFIKEDIPDKLYAEEDEIPEGKKVGDLKKAAYTTYGLRYNEFISPLIKAVQELSAEVDTLKTKVAALEAHTHE